MEISNLYTCTVDQQLIIFVLIIFHALSKLYIALCLSLKTAVTLSVFVYCKVSLALMIIIIIITIMTCDCISPHGKLQCFNGPVYRLASCAKVKNTYASQANAN